MGILLAAGLALAQATVTLYTATEAPGAIIDPGTVTFPDGNMHLRGAERYYTRVGSDPRVSGGTLTGVTNANLDKNMSGPIWGTFRWEIGGGVWEGTWQGRFNFVTGAGEYESVGHGSGDFRGLQMRDHCVYTAGTGACAGRILETPRS